MLLPVLCEDRWVFVVNGTYCHLDSVLIDTLIAKGVDVSAIYDGVEISFAKKIALNEENNKIIFA